MTKFTPFWWDGQPQFENTEALRLNADIVIIGAGYTGLSAALTLSKFGKNVIVLDSEMIGFGASTRNGGMLGSGHKVSTDQAKKKYGEVIAAEIHKEANASLAFTSNLIEENNIDCEFNVCGRLRTSWLPKDQVSMSDNLQKLKAIDDFNSKMIGPDMMSKSIKTELYFGGQFYQDHGSVQPRKFHYGLLKLALGAGAKVFGNRLVVKVNKLKQNGFDVLTSKDTQGQVFQSI